MTNKAEIKKQPFYYIFLLIFAGEAVFILPFVLVRIFRPTFLELFQVNNLQLGYCFSIYGFVALVSYFFGGLIADRFAPGKIMGLALILTGLGGFYLAQYPTFTNLKLLYGYWGCTTILMFWAAMIKATRMWGGQDRQGKAFGFLDGGRGLVAAGFGSLGLWVLSIYAIGDLEDLNFSDKRNVFRNVIWTFSTIVVSVGAIVFLILKPEKFAQNSDKDVSEVEPVLSWKTIKPLLKIPIVWMMMIIILTGYCGYKITDVFSLYARDVMLYNEVDSASIGTLLLYLRPILGIVIGILADRSRSSLWLIIGFLVMLVGSILMASGIIGPSLTLVFNLSIFVTALGIYTIRCLYFAILEEGAIPTALTGTIVGLVSLVGYTPDIFMGPVIGILLDNNPGELGHQYVFGLLAIIALIGLSACLFFIRSVNSNRAKINE